MLRKQLQVGRYDDLDIAVTVVAIGYGVGETQWTPACESHIALDASAGVPFWIDAPPIFGRVRKIAEHRAIGCATEGKEWRDCDERCNSTQYHSAR